MLKKRNNNIQIQSQLIELLNKYTGELSQQKESFRISLKKLTQEGKQLDISDTMSLVTSTMETMLKSFHSFQKDLELLESQHTDTARDQTSISAVRSSLSKEVEALEVITDNVLSLRKLILSQKDT